MSHFFTNYVNQILKKMQIVERFENIVFVTNLVNFEMTIFVIITSDYRVLAIINNFKMTLVFDINFSFHKAFIFRVNRF